MASSQPQQNRPNVQSSQSIRNRSLWGSYKALPARTRLYISMGICTVGAVGLFVSDYLQKVLPPQGRRTTPDSRPQ
ncbi:hypothetical protein SCLCIDRAFT_1207603 [Scleroderma citrinum Foug A]|uniref:Uncharacterized protein n=1 Tax=Scleroderma citrinum Foug A TaxID=1036808 RepID=A0A0C3EC64_9AGAM|nr:hypothetical protein SCLCIDRAFT_1207603 [Scleroderma citrinum Foug A]